jgi:hypothetical protein
MVVVGALVDVFVNVVVATADVESVLTLSMELGTKDDVDSVDVGVVGVGVVGGVVGNVVDVVVVVGIEHVRIRHVQFVGFIEQSCEVCQHHPRKAVIFLDSPNNLCRSRFAVDCDSRVQSTW